MTTSYELIDYESGNLVGSYATEKEARAVVRRACEAEGNDVALGLGLIRVRDGSQELVAEDLDLLREAPAPVGALSSES
jgi:hypothetical protein